MPADRTTAWETVTRMSETTTNLSFAVLLVDAVTGGRPTGDVSVGLATAPDAAVENPSGFHLFLDLETDPVTLVVDGGDRYVDERRTVYHVGSPPSDEAGVEIDDPGTPVVVTLAPTPAYQFPAGTTRLRGTVTDGTDDTPVGGATVSLEGFDGKARTTDAGEFALHVPATAKHVVRVDGTQLVKAQQSDDDASDGGGATDPPGGGSGQPGAGGSPSNGPSSGGPAGNGPPADDDNPPPDPELTVRHPSYTPWTRQVAVEAGELTTRDVELQP